MKILKLRGDFKKMPDKNWNDALKINKMVELGWSFANHKEYKDVYGAKNSTVVDNKKVEKVQKIKKVKETKVEKKDKKKK